MELFGVAWHDTREAMQGFVDRYGITFPTIVDEDDSVFNRFGFFYQPAWAFVNDDGTVEALFEGLSQQEVRAHFDRLVAS